MVIYILSKIWASGAKINRLPSGELNLQHHELVDETVLKAAEPIFNEIDNYIKSVEGMKAVDLTNWKIIMFMCGWIKNDTIENFLNNDEKAGELAFEFQAKLAVSGWKDIYTDYRQYENPVTDKLKLEIYNRAVAYAKGAK